MERNQLRRIGQAPPRTITVGLAVLLAGCGLFGTQVEGKESAGHENKASFPTWEQAAVAEALRLNPGLTHAKASKFEMTSGDKRMRVTADDGYCHIFGGNYDGRRGWQANDIGSCGP